MKATGRMICKMAPELKHGLMVQDIKANTKKVKNMVKASIYGTISLAMMDIGMKTKLMALVYMNGQMVVAIKVNGRITTCMAEVSIPGRMDVCMMENIKTIENMVLVLTLGLMVDNI